MAFKKPKEIFMSFVADESMLADIRSSIDETIADLNLSTKEKNGILLAIEEACTNVIRHAYLFGPGTIRIKIKILPNKVTFSIYDKGRRFDFKGTETPDLDRYVKTGRKGGLGLYLIRKMMDSVDYYARDGENELRMVKSFQPKSQQVFKAKGLSIRLKFAMWASLVVFVIVGAISLYYDHRNSSTIERQYFAEAYSFGHTTALNAADKIVVENVLELAGLAKSAMDGNPNLKYIAITDSNGLVWADVLNPQNILTSYTHPGGVDPMLVGEFQHYQNDESIDIYHLISSIKLNDQPIGAIHLGFYQVELSKQLSASRKSIILFALLGLVVGLGAVYMLSYFFVKPIQKLTEGVLKIGQGNLEEALPVDGTDEFSEIAKAFNEITTKFKQAQDNVVEQELLQKEMQVAQEIQHALLPNRFPEIEGYELAAVYRAAKDVGGDYFDFVWIDENTLGIAVADVSGKGVPGSLVMTMIRTAIRLESRNNYQPNDILAKVNDFVSEDVKKGMFITIFFIILDSKKRQISFASAGHNPMILFRKDTNKCYFLNPKGMPLGMTLPDNISFGGDLQTDKLKLKKDDMLVIYTDGITEAMNNRAEQYGNDRLIDFIKDNAELKPEEFADKLDQDLAQFTGNAAQNDDITLVVVKEQIMADELILEKRKRLLKMVEEEGMPIEKACEEMGVSASTFYKYRRRWRREGDSGLLNKRLRADAGIKQLPYGARKNLLDFIRANPELGAARLQKSMLELGENFSVRNIYDELVAMRLNTKKLRLAYVERVGQLKPEQKEMLEKEILRDAQKELDRTEYAEDLQKNIEKRQVDQITKDTGKVISQLKQLKPATSGDDLFDEIASGLEKLDGGKEIAQMFQTMMSKVGPELKPSESVPADTPDSQIPETTESAVVDQSPSQELEPSDSVSADTPDSQIPETTEPALVDQSPSQELEPSDSVSADAPDSQIPKTTESAVVDQSPNQELEPSDSVPADTPDSQIPKTTEPAAADLSESQELKPVEPGLTDIPDRRETEPSVQDKSPKPVEVAPQSSEKIDIDDKAIKQEGKSSVLDDMAEYEKKLMRKYKK
ncbi:MAG: SpoIIE family protein phosphatase [candidate division Zixibacteria bacterium]|nr:SpoIIE family protein phosphatase [candidate division Zixibacteria bacterium]